MARFKYINNVCCVLLLCYVSTWATPIATSKLTSDLSQVKIDLNQGGSLSFFQYDSPYFTYVLQQTDVELVANTVWDQNFYTDALPGNSTSISGFFDEGFSESMASATVPQGTAYARSHVSSYITFKAEDVSSVTLTLDVDASIDLSTESYGEWASTLWDVSLDLFTWTENGSYTPIANTTYYSDSYDVSDGEVMDSTETQKISITYNFGEKYNGYLSLQSILTTDALFEVSPPVSVPEPSGATMMIVGLAALLPLVQIRKKNN